MRAWAFHRNSVAGEIPVSVPVSTTGSLSVTQVGSELDVSGLPRLMASGFWLGLKQVFHQFELARPEPTGDDGRKPGWFWSSSIEQR